MDDQSFVTSHIQKSDIFSLYDAEKLELNLDSLTSVSNFFFILYTEMFVYSKYLFVYFFSQLGKN